jgi:hypothetical protein
MDFSRLNRAELLGAAASILLIVAVFLPWYGLDKAPDLVRNYTEQKAWLCGTGNFNCSAWEQFNILRFLLIAAAAAPLILAWIILRGHSLGWPPGQLTMVVGLTATVLIGYNGIVSKPWDFGGSLKWGYLVGLVAAVGIAAAGIWRSYQMGGGPERKPPGTF